MPCSSWRLMVAWTIRRRVCSVAAARLLMSYFRTIKLTAAETGGEMSLIEVAVGANYSAPLHVHYTDDESFWILEGRVSFEVGGADGDGAQRAARAPPGAEPRPA